MSKQLKAMLVRSKRLAAACGALVLAPAFARGQDTTCLSVDSAGLEADDESVSTRGAVAEDGGGLFVVFQSSATNFDPKDLNGKSDIYLRDVEAATTKRIVFGFAGNEPDGDSFLPKITPDGRFVAFSSHATNLVKSDQNACIDVFVLDRKTGLVERVSVADDGSEADATSLLGGISDDGQLVAFFSSSDLLVAKDGNLRSDVFVRDRSASTTICVSRAGSGVTGNDSSLISCISGDGRKVAFESRASDLVANDGNGLNDVFVHDLKTGFTERASVNAGGFELDDESRDPALSADGALLAFHSAASNLHRDSTDGILQVWVRDLATGEIWLASRGIDGLAADDDCGIPTLFTRSGAGPVVAFWSGASNLSDDGSPHFCAYVVDFKSGLRQRVSVDTHGDPGPGPRSPLPVAASPAGDAVVFTTDDGLAPGDGNLASDVYLRGLQWTELAEFGSGLAGTGGYVPRLTGLGGSCEADRWHVEVVDGLPQAPGHLWVGFGSTSGLPLFGGTFYLDFAQPVLAIPILLGGPAGLGGAGELLLDGVNVENLGAFSLFLQCTFLDAHAPKGVSLSNALEIAIDA